MVLCAAYNCNVRSGHGKTLFSFPKDQDLCRKWVERLKTKDYWPSKHSRLCECHFDDDQFIWNRLIAKDAGYSKLLLKPEAIPSVFDYTPRVHKRGHKRKSEPSPGDEGTPIPTKTPKRRMAVLKRRALKFLSSTDENDLTEIVPSATESPICTMMDSSTIPDSDTSEEIQTSFDVFCQTSYGLISRRHARVQTEIYDPEPYSMKKTSRTIQTQTEITESSEDLDASFVSYSSDSSVRDPDWTPTPDVSFNHGDANETTVHKERKFIVFESSLDSLTERCKYCGASAYVDKTVKGTFLKLNISCHCGAMYSWESQPVSSSMPYGNLMLAAGIMFAGASSTQFLKIMSHAGVCCFSIRTYNNIQTAYLVPSIQSVWKCEQMDLFTDIRNSDQQVVLGGDARCCSPGHTAKFGSYSVMDLKQSKILDIQLVQSNEVKNSYAMELEGLKRCLSWLEENNILISDLVTDRHSQVKKFMKTERPDIEHWFDCWHVAKGVYKKLEAAGRKKGSEAVGEWARSVSNHLYWCASSSEGNGELVQQKWLSILNHVTDIHEGHGSLFERCQHEELSDRNWMRKGSKSHMEMEKVVKGRLLLTDVKKLSPAEQTSGLEAFHKVVCHFAPKLVHFFHAQMEARLFLAALHFNENSEREQRLTKDGRLQYAVSYPKGRDHDGISKEVKEPMTYEYVDRLMEEVIFQRETHTSYAIASQKRQLEQLRPTPISQSREHRPKELVVAERIHRFN